MRKISKTWSDIINEENYIVGATVNGIQTMINFEKHNLPEETDPVMSDVSSCELRFGKRKIENREIFKKFRIIIKHTPICDN